MRYVVFYDSADDVMETAPLHFEAHVEHFTRYLEDGTLERVGTWSDPREGAMSVLTTRDAAERFAADDPFVVNGVVRSYRIAEWDEIVTREADRP
jgi:uncharacterized protein YciI